MNEGFYQRCKNVVGNLKLTYEQGIARDVILNELDMLEKQAEDYQNRFNNAVNRLKELKLLTPMEYEREEQIDILLKMLEEE